MRAVANSAAYRREALSEPDRTAVIRIFDVSALESFAAYREEPEGDEFFDRVPAMSKGCPAVAARTEAGEAVGFGFLRAFIPPARFRERRRSRTSCCRSTRAAKSGAGCCRGVFAEDSLAWGQTGRDFDVVWFQKRL